MIRPPTLDRPKAEFSGFAQGDGLVTSPDFVSIIGTLLSIAPCESICTNRSTILREEVEARVLNGLRDTLLHPDLLATFVEEYRRAFNAAADDAGAGRDKAKRDLAKVEKKITSILSAIEDGIYHPSMKEKMAALEQEKAILTAFL